MSVAYNQSGQPYYNGPTGKVNFGWISELWTIFSQAPGIWIGACAIYGAIIIAMIAPFEVQAFQTGLASQGTSPNTNIPFTPSSPMYGWYCAMEIVMCFVEIFALSSLLRVALKQVRREPVRFADAFSGGPVMGWMFLYGLLAGLFSLLGVIALIIGSIVTTALIVPGFALIADGDRPITAFKRSFAAVKRDWLSAAGFYVVILLLIIVSEIPCGLGLFVTVPMSYICLVLAYRDMVGMTGIREPQYSYGAAAPGVWPPPPGYAQPQESQDFVQQSPYYTQPAAPQQPYYTQAQSAPISNQPQPTPELDELGSVGQQELVEEKPDFPEELPREPQ